MIMVNVLVMNMLLEINVILVPLDMVIFLLVTNVLMNIMDIQIVLVRL